MGVCIQDIELIGPDMNFQSAEMNLQHNWVWVCIRIDPVVNKYGVHDWHLQGIAADEEIAIGMCVDETYIIGPLPLNSTLPHDKIEWIGSYSPYRK